VARPPLISQARGITAIGLNDEVCAFWPFPLRGD
jgi:hypothetical protein